jgi:hypothetical protein
MYSAEVVLLETGADLSLRNEPAEIQVGISQLEFPAGKSIIGTGAEDVYRHLTAYVMVPAVPQADIASFDCETTSLGGFIAPVEMIPEPKIATDLCLASFGPRKTGACGDDEYCED